MYEKTNFHVKNNSVAGGVNGNVHKSNNVPMFDIRSVSFSDICS